MSKATTAMFARTVVLIVERLYLVSTGSQPESKLCPE